VDSVSRFRVPVTALAGLIVCLGVGIGHATAASADNLFTGVTAEVVTPHFEWCPRYAGGRPRVLVIAPAFGQRETVELMQRFDLECTALMTWTTGQLAAGGYGPAAFLAPDQVAERFDRELAREWDAILIGRLDWPMLHLEHRAAILRQVYERGAGLVLVSPSHCRELDELTGQQAQAGLAEHLAATVPWTDLPVSAGRRPGEVISGGTFGKGRWLALRYEVGGTNHSLTPPGPLPCLSPWYYEYSLSLLAQGILWAARREPAAVPVFAADGGLQITATEERPGVTVQLWYHSLPEQRVVDGRALTCDLRKGTTAVAVPPGQLPEGPYVITALVQHEGATLGWTSTAVAVTAPLRIETLALERDPVGAGEAIRGRVVLSAALGEGQRLELQLSDHRGRLLAAEPVPVATGTEVPFELPGIQPLDGALHRLRVLLVTASRQLLSTRTLEFAIRGSPVPDFHLAIWEENETDPVSALWYSRFRDLGVDAIFYRSERAAPAAASVLMARAGLLGAPMFACYSPKPASGQRGPEHPGCLHDPHALAQGIATSQERARIWSRFGVLHYGDGSDKELRGVCFCEHTLRALRADLQQRYGTLAALNQSWQTAFARWDDVVPDTLEQARQRRVFRPWLDHIQFMERTYAAYNAAMVQAVQAIDPGAAVGPDGHGRLNSADGSDWAQLLDAFTFYNLYTYQDPPQMEITRSLAARRPGVRLRSLYYGSYDGQFGNVPFLRRLPWYALLHGYNGLYWWLANGKTTYPCVSGCLAGPDFRETASFAVSLGGIRELRTGPAQLLGAARRDHCGIALLYDQLVVHAHTAWDHPSRLVAALTDLEAALEDLGLQYDYVTAAEVRAGLLGQGGYRALLLPRALAMADDTRAAIASFAAAGGTVVADLAPGQYDAALAPAPAPLPAVLLGDALAGYARQRFAPSGKAARAALHSALAPAGCEPPVRLSADPATDDRTGVPGVEVVRYRDGQTDYLGLLNWGPPVSLAVRLPQARVRCDLRSRTVAGTGDTWPETLDAGGCALYALLPAPPLAAQVAGLPGAGVEVSAPAAPAATGVRRAFVVAVTDPSGVARPEYGGVVLADAARPARHPLPLALNDPSGEWTVTVTDVLSGQRHTLPMPRTVR